MRISFNTLPTLLAIAALSSTVLADVKTISNGNMSVDVNDATGDYSVKLSAPAWEFGGTVGHQLQKLNSSEGTDKIGTYDEISFDSAAPVPRSATIRAYRDRSIVSFGYSLHEAVTTQPPAFPNLTKIPSGLHILSHQNEVFARPAYGRAVQTSTPWLLFDDVAQAVIISPAANFMTANMLGDGTTQIASALDPDLQKLPKDFAHSTVLAFGKGVGSCYAAWGAFLTDSSGKTRPAYDSDIGLKYFGYWTDNGAGYYYNYDVDKGYAGTLLAVRDEMKRLGVPIKYLQLDSWWYQKTTVGANGVDSHTPKNANLPRGTWNAYGGLLKWEAHPDLFPDGLAAFQKQLGLPLITHNRWVDAQSEYHKKYKISGLAAVDPGYWNELASYLKSSGGITYEQDWLREMWNYSPELHSTYGLADQFMDAMASACRDNGLTMQYCMGLPRHFMQGSRYNNLTSIRTSDDKFGRSRWQDFLYVNQVAYSLGEWPWADVFRSNETPNILLATLSAGMVGIGDRIGETSVENVMCAVRSDGVIVKPDETIVPTDETYVANARSSESPVIAVARSSGAVPTVYVFGFPRSAQQMEMRITLAKLGLSGDVWIYNWKTKTGVKSPADQTFAAAFTGTPRDAWEYFIIAPVQANGIAFLGDAGKFASNGRQRIASIASGQSELTATVAFAPDEKQVTLHGYAAAAPHATADSGKAELTYDAATSHFTLTLVPAAAAAGQSQQAAVHLSTTR